VVGAGGLHIIGTERHESRRIDNQLRGRAGRQGDPGSSRFFLSLEDDLMRRFASERVASMMERLGLEDDVAIESRMVSKTIESAQSRVEGFNFDIRKRVVEFDDVINRQRETIYAERDKVLRNEDLTETVRNFLDAEVETLAATYVGSASPSDWNLEGLSNALKVMGLEGDDVTVEALDEIATGRESAVEYLNELIEAKLEAMETEHGEEVWSQVERVVLLRTIDSLWVEHLTEVDDMRRGIGLRGYAQQDPLNEFRKEAFRLYQELRDLIRHQVASTVFRVTVTRQQQAPAPGAPVAMPGPGQPARPVPAAVGAGEAERPATALGGAAPFGASGAGAAPVAGLPADPMRSARASFGDRASGPGEGRPGYTPSGERIGRNDPCWCGSGQKYKKCHGR
jgi:preprotein translocase subunit SecA